MKNLFIQKNTKKNLRQVLNNRGFTIVETLVAIFILLISTTGPLAFAQSSLRSSFLARDQVTAFYLAQEAIETIKNIRDNNQIQGSSDWLDGLSECAPTTDFVTCNIEVSSSETEYYMSSCYEERCQQMKYDPDIRQFILNSNSNSSKPQSKYTRTVYLKKINSHELQIIVEVSWTSSYFAPKRIIVQENIFERN